MNYKKEKEEIQKKINAHNSVSQQAQNEVKKRQQEILQLAGEYRFIEKLEKGEVVEKPKSKLKTMASKLLGKKEEPVSPVPKEKEEDVEKVPDKTVAEAVVKENQKEVKN